MTVPRPIVDTLRDAARVLVLTHVYPDGDALGSQLALGQALAALGKEVVLFGEQPVSHLYDFLPGSAAVVTELPDVGTFDCAVALDCGDAHRLGRNEERLLEAHPFLVIDHHAGHQEFGDLRWVDPARASTGEMVFDLLRELGVEAAGDVAFCLYTAIVSDTGSFKYSSTTATTLRTAAELIDGGVKPAVVAGRLYDNYSVGRLELLKAVLATLELYEDNRLAFIHVTAAMFVQTGAVEQDAENFINYPRSLVTVRIAVFIKEARDGVISVSLRSKGASHDVAAVARQFGGGGHRNAAGFKLSGTSVDEVRSRLLATLRPLLADGGAR
ncbi:MAG: bifunctional oligoribonuclease/PAP phosphatase NrnA [Thermodesulfobacteriota bacterium]